MLFGDGAVEQGPLGAELVEDALDLFLLFRRGRNVDGFVLFSVVRVDIALQSGQSQFDALQSQWNEYYITRLSDWYQVMRKFN